MRLCRLVAATTATRTFGGGDVENGPRSRRYGFDYKACISVVNSAAGGLTVAAVLKFADAVLKGYATAISVILTGLFSMLFFGELAGRMLEDLTEL